MPRDDVPERIGYKRPPQHSRFRKGQSGNPSGRPKGRPQLNLLEEIDKVLAEPIIVNKNGRPQKISRLAAIAHKLVEGALKNDSRATALTVKLLLERQLGPAQPEEVLTSEQEEALIARFLARTGKGMGGGNG